MKLVIRQIEGSVRRLELEGSALPLKPWESRTAQRGDATWTGHHGKAAAGMWGGMRPPTEADFYWLTAELATGGGRATLHTQQGAKEIKDAVLLKDAMDELVLEPSEVTVSWNGRELPAVLRGFFSQEFDPGEVEATLELEWLMGAIIPAKAEQSVSKDTGGFAQRVRRGLRTATGYANYPASTFEGYMDTAQGALNEIGGATRALEAVHLRYQNAAGQGPALHQRAAALAGSISTQARTLFDAVAQPIEAIIGAEEVDPATLIQAAQGRGIMMEWSITTTHEARERADAWITDTPSDGWGQHIAQGTEDIRRVALKHYGEASVWPDLLDANPHLEGEVLSAGDVVNLPPRRDLL